MAACGDVAPSPSGPSTRPATQPPDVVPQVVGLRFQGEDALDAGEVQTGVEVHSDALDAVDVASAVAARPALGPYRGEQTAVLVDPQHLRVDAGQLSGHRDGVQRAVGIAGCGHRPSSSFVSTGALDLSLCLMIHEIYVVHYRLNGTRLVLLPGGER